MDHDVETPARDPRLLIVLGVLAAISAVVAGFVIFSDGPQAAPPPEATAPLTATTTSLQMGPANAPSQVVVVEDLASPQSRSFDIASRDFLEIAAAQGTVRVTYQLVGPEVGVGAAASGAWATLLREATPRQVLRFQQRVLDAQPEAPDGSSRLIDLARRAGVKDPDVLSAVGGAAGEDATAVLRAGLRTQLGTGDPSFTGPTRGPVVLLDGSRMRASTPVALADALQRALLEKES